MLKRYAVQRGTMLPRNSVTYRCEHPPPDTGYSRYHVYNNANLFYTELYGTTRIEGIQGSEHIGHMHSTYGIFWVESKKSLPQVGRITYIDTHHTSYIYIPHSSIMFGTEVLLYTALHYCCMSSILYGGLGPTVYHSIS